MRSAHQSWNGRRSSAAWVFAIALGVVGVSCGDSSGSGSGESIAVGEDGASGDEDAQSRRDVHGDAGTTSDSERRDGSEAGPWIVETAEGPVQGVNDSGWTFLGIPYARPPTGERRWSAPRRPESWEEPLVADEYMDSCPQPSQSNQLADPGPTSEDCLGLNVWAPSRDPDADAPVLVWIHGGAFLFGSSRVTYPDGTQLYDGRKLAQRGVVVVSLNYRLGPFGFLAHPEMVGDDPEYEAAGNYGFLDQVAALEWVQRNIDAFGGDPDNVTLFGESAGGISICGHLVADVSRDLFDRAIMQSGSCPEYLRRLDEARGELDSAFAQGERVAEELGCGEEGLSCMREKSPEGILEALETTSQPSGNGEAFGPIVDGALFSGSFWSELEAGSGAEVPIIAGATRDEGTLWASPYASYSETQYEEWVEMNYPNRAEGVLEKYPAGDYEAPWKAIAAILGDVYFTCPARWTVREHTDQGNPAFHYLFSHVTDYGEQQNLGAFHGIELEFVFDNFVRPFIPQEERTLARRMQESWLQFAREGSPGSVGDREWPRYDLESDQTLVFDTGTVETRTGYRSEYCEFWAQ